MSNLKSTPKLSYSASDYATEWKQLSAAIKADYKSYTGSIDLHEAETWWNIYRKRYGYGS